MVTVPVILAGGIGERFWPMSRSSTPKQLLRLVSSKTMLEETLERIAPLCRKGTVRPLIISGKLIARQISKLLSGKAEFDQIIEPEGKNTAPAILIAAAYIEKKYGPSVMLILSADHDIRPASAYLSAVRGAVRFALENDALVVFGIRPSRPECGYGYLKLGAAVATSPGATIQKVLRFIEKPSLEKARKFVQEKSVFWNSGMFVWRTSVILHEFQEYLPAHYTHLGEAASLGFSPKGIDRYYMKCEKISIDYGIMERSSKVYAVVGNFSWDDIGSWESVSRIHGKDAAGVTKVGPNIEIFDCSNTLLFNNTSMTCAAIGLDDTVLVVTDDALLAVRRSKLDDLKKYLSLLKKKGNLPKKLF
jgi:mannose-1-phosphate guanylyltransferase